MTAKISSTLGRIFILFSKKVLFLATCLLAGCTALSGISSDGGGTLSVVAVANTRSQPGQTIVELNAVASGGTGPYTITWEIVEGPVSPTVPEGAFAEVALNETGAYTFVVTATDSDGKSATETIVVDIVVDTPVAPLSASAGPDSTVILSAAIVLEGSASGGEGNYAYEWSPITGLSDPNVAQPTLNTAGLSLGPAEFVLTVTDGTGTTASDAVTITISQSGGGPAPTAINSVKWGPDFAGGGYQVLVDFSQIMNQASVETLTGYRINGTATNPTSASLVGNTVTLVFAVAMKTTDTVDVSVGGSIVDSFGRILSEKLNQAIAANGETTAPTISSTAWAANYTGSGYQLTVVFNEAMDQTTAETLANYRINGTAVNPTAASLGTDGKTATLTFTTLALDTANTLDVSLAAAVTDINAQAKTQVLAQAIAANGETTAPTISSTAWAANYTGSGYQLTVVFNEAMDETTAETLTNYRINGTATNPATASLGTDGKTVTLTFTALALDTANTIDVSLAAAVTDINAQAKTQVLAQAIAANAETTAPTISSTAWAANFAGAGYQLTVVFNEAMDETTAETLTNYRINGTATNPATASLGTDGKTVTLTFNSLPLDTANSLDVSLAAAVRDINAQAKTEVLAQAIAANAETNLPTVTSSTRINATRVDIVFNEAVDETTAEAAVYTFSGNPTLTSAELQNDGVTVQLTVGTEDPAGDTVTVPNTVTDINANATAGSTSGTL